MKYLFLVTILGVVLIYTDFQMAKYIGRVKRDEVADYRARLPQSHLDFHGERRQGCIVEKVYAIYSFQTCFFLWESKGEDGGVFRYIYHQPTMAIFSIISGNNSRYFAETYFGEELGTIREGKFSEKNEADFEIR